MSLNKFYSVYIFCFCVFFCIASYGEKKTDIFTIMLDPAGDAQNTGRQIDDCLERGISLQFAQKLKQELENTFKDIRVVLTRLPGEKVQHLQNANFANRLDVDFYLSIHFYKENSVRPKVFAYTFSYNDDFITKKSDLYFCSYDKAHLIHRSKTKKYANLVKNKLEENKKIDFSGLWDLPFKPLIGIKAPAIGIEIGLRNKENWGNFIDLFLNLIHELGSSL